MHHFAKHPGVLVTGDSAACVVKEKHSKIEKSCKTGTTYLNIIAA